MPLDAVHYLVLDVIGVGKDPADRPELDNLVLFSPDICVDIAFQRNGAGAK